MTPPERPRIRTRQLVDDYDRIWTVRERVDDLKGHPDRRSLVFDGTDMMRRLWVYPDDWFELSDADLLALSVAPPARRPLDPPTASRRPQP